MKNYKILNAENLYANIDKFNSKKICAMVKCNAYGHGLKEIVSLAKDRVDYFGVVSIEEALQVRKITDKPVLVCAKVFDYKKCKNYDIDVIVDNENDLLTAINCKNNIHLKINSGMNRFGIKSELIMMRLNKIIEENAVEIKFLHTHFSNAGNKKITNEQYENFLRIARPLKQNVPVCFGGSAISSYDLDCEMFRVGIALYGYGEGMKPVEQITSFVSKIFYARKGELIGYGEKYKVKNDSLFAVVPVGYGDGLSRNLCEKFCVKINEKEYKTVGNICMDAFFVKVDETVKVGDIVVVMEDARELSYDTIEYETLTRFSNFRGKTVIK